eukprot:2686411-Lingulodinium_polyedra.AAC.1
MRGGPLRPRAILGEDASVRGAPSDQNRPCDPVPGRVDEGERGRIRVVLLWSARIVLRRRVVHCKSKRGISALYGNIPEPL